MVSVSVLHNTPPGTMLRSISGLMTFAIVDVDLSTYTAGGIELDFSETQLREYDVAAAAFGARSGYVFAYDEQARKLRVYGEQPPVAYPGGSGATPIAMTEVAAGMDLSGIGPVRGVMFMTQGDYLRF